MRILRHEYLQQHFDADARLASVPKHYMIKGMFVASLLRSTGCRVDLKQLPLLRPPSGGRYLPFFSYPQLDYSRIAIASAAALFPRLPLAEAARRIARTDMRVFAATSVGRTMLALVNDVEEAFLQFPKMYAAVVDGGQLITRRPRPGHIELTLLESHAWVDCYSIGTVEGILDAFERDATLEVELHSATAATYHISLKSR